mmetsp:Transcript_13900/g.30266  ORF Transcript_13900/g.30266 Transcript_13900/m.30266 type:complete len:155 (+) Transcript_13900:130-594(+)
MLLGCCRCCSEEKQYEDLPVALPETRSTFGEVPNMEDIKVSVQNSVAVSHGRPSLRAWQFRVRLVKNSLMGKIGLDIAMSQSHFEGPALKVKKVKDGMIAAYNGVQLDAMRRVREGDYIIEVNGLVGNTRAMLHTLQSGDVIDLLVSRPPPDAR